MIEFRIGDVFERLAEIPDGSIDLIVTSPPFLALRSYLPADHPDKHREIGSEPTPAEFLDTLLALSAEWERVLAPHGSLCVELGDTYAGSGGAGGDYNPGGLREGQGAFDGAAARNRGGLNGRASMVDKAIGGHHAGGRGWPLAKSRTMIDTLYPACLAYGRNLLTGEPSPAGQWRIRNLIVWARPNPPVGALGDKFRPATSHITVACKGAKRYFDIDAVRTEAIDQRTRNTNGPKVGDPAEVMTANYQTRVPSNVAGAPPLDWHSDMPDEDGDWLWKLSTQPYAGSHYATFPLTLPKRLIEAMCPQRVCTTCGKPSERVTTVNYEALGDPAKQNLEPRAQRGATERGVNGSAGQFANGRALRHVDTTGWTDCGHNTWRTGVVLDPFAGSGTTIEAAQAVGRHAIGIDLDSRNVALASDRVGMFLEVQDARPETDTARDPILDIRSARGA